MLVATIALALSLANGQKLSFDARVGDPQLLKYDIVQKELKVTPDQISDIDRAEADYHAKSKSSQHWNSDEERAAVSKYLTVAQQKRLREISLQQAGPIVLIVDFVDERLGMSSERQKKIQGAFNDAINEAIKPMTNEISEAVSEEMKNAGSDPDEIEKHSQRASKRAEEISNKFDHKSIAQNAAKKILSVLTQSEAKAWKDLQGAPFPIDQLPKDHDDDNR